MTPERWITLGIGILGAVIGVVSSIATFGARLTGIERDVRALQDGRADNHACIEALRADIRALSELVARMDERQKRFNGGGK